MGAVAGLVKPGTTIDTFRVNATPNTVDNTPRSFTVTLSNPTGGAVITKPTETITILDND